jgi:hypothetical protein
MQLLRQTSKTSPLYFSSCIHTEDAMNATLD